MAGDEGRIFGAARDCAAGGRDGGGAGGVGLRVSADQRPECARKGVFCLRIGGACGFDGGDKRTGDVVDAIGVGLLHGRGFGSGGLVVGAARETAEHFKRTSLCGGSVGRMDRVHHESFVGGKRDQVWRPALSRVVIDADFEAAAAADGRVRMVFKSPDRQFFGELFAADEKRMGFFLIS